MAASIGSHNLELQDERLQRALRLVGQMLAGEEVGKSIGNEYGNGRGRGNQLGERIACAQFEGD